MNFLKDYSKIKRVFDFLLGLTGLFVSLPLWLIFGMAIWLEDAGPIFYLQERVGKNGRIFKGLKFRSMRLDAEQGRGPVQAQRHDPRSTKIGAIMRATAMDELPQLINILKGEMSFVGPRALRPIETELTAGNKVRALSEIPGFKERSSVIPGLTGAAQVFASRTLSREEKFKYDLWYIEHMNFWLDIRLILKSIFITLEAKWDS